MQPELFLAKLWSSRTLGVEGVAALIIRRAVKATFLRAAGALAKAMALVASGVIRIMVVVRVSKRYTDGVKSERNGENNSSRLAEGDRRWLSLGLECIFVNQHLFSTEGRHITRSTCTFRKLRAKISICVALV